MKIKLLVLPLLILAIISNCIPMSSGASASQITEAMYKEMVYSHISDYIEDKIDTTKYHNYILSYEVIFRDDGVITAVGNAYNFSDDSVISIYSNDNNTLLLNCNNGYETTFSYSIKDYLETPGGAWVWGKPNIHNITYIGISKNKTIKMNSGAYSSLCDVLKKSEINVTDDDVIGGIPLQESDLKVIYYQSVNDKSQNFSLTNNTNKDIYTTFDLYAVTGDEQGKTYEHILYKYYQKSLINSSEELQVVYMKYTGLKTYYLLVSDNPNYNAPASWLAGFFRDKNIFPDENAAMESSGSTDYFAKLLSNYSVWFNKAVLCDGNIQAAYDIVFDNYSGNYDPNSKLDLEAKYPVTLYQADADVPLHNLYYSYSNKILVPAGQQITVSIPSKYLQIQENYRYAWDVCYAAKLDDPFYSHTKKYFTADFTSSYVADPNYIYGSGGSVTDIDDNVVGEYDENGDLYIDEDSNNKFVTDEDDGNNATFENIDVKQVKTLWGKAQEFILFFNDAMGAIPGWCKSLFAAIFVLVCLKILIKFLSA